MLTDQSKKQNILQVYGRKAVENALKNAIDEIRDYAHEHSGWVKSSTKDVWGKEVRRFKNIGGNSFAEERAELENWYYTAKCNTFDSIDELISFCKQKAAEIEKEKIDEAKREYKDKGESDRPNSDWTIHHLADWCFLQDEGGNILNEGDSGFVTLVRYAKVLPDLKETVADDISYA